MSNENRCKKCGKDSFVLINDLCIKCQNTWWFRRYLEEKANIILFLVFNMPLFVAIVLLILLWCGE